MVMDRFGVLRKYVLRVDRVEICETTRRVGTREFLDALRCSLTMSKKRLSSEKRCTSLCDVQTSTRVHMKILSRDIEADALWQGKKGGG